MKQGQQTIDDLGGGSSLAEALSSRYRIQRELGHGGMGRVFAVEDLQSSRTVALKLLRGVTPEGLFRLKHEFRTLAELQHRNVIVPFELSLHEDVLCYTMELVDGQSIVEHCRDAEPDRKRDTLLQLLGALESIHDRGIVHRDLKPANILVARDGRVVVLDFGIAKTLSESAPTGITGDRAWLGTPAYMAPEQFEGTTCSPATDWYAFGVVLYECFTGRPAFPQADIQGLVDAKLEHRFADAALSEEPLRRLVGALLERDPQRRPGPRQIRSVLRDTARATAPAVRRERLFVDRRAELGALDERLAAASSAGRVQAVVLRGEPGIGKTEVLAEFRAHARRSRSAFVACARSSALEILPLRIIDGLLDDIISQVRADSRIPVERCYPRHAAELGALFPCAKVLFGNGGHHGGGISPTSRELGLRAVSDMLARMSEHVPLVLAFDDMHRCDGDSLDAILRLVLDLSECRVLFVFAATTQGARTSTHFDDFLAGCRRHVGQRGVTDVTLAPLPRDMLVPIAWNAAWGFTGPAETIEALCRHARGNPGMCRFYARALLDEGTGELVEVHTDGDERLDAVLFRRVWGLLSDAARDLMTCIALAAGGLPRAVLDDVFGGSETTDAALRDLEHHGILDRHGYARSGGVDVWHERLRSHTLDLCPPEDAKAWHGRLAEAFTRHDVDDGGGAAFHYREHGDLAEAVHHFARAAASARSSHAHRRAIELLRAALELGHCPPPLRRSLELDLADSLGRVGRLREAADRGLQLAAEARPGDASSHALRVRAIEQYAALADVERSREVVLRELLGDGTPPSERAWMLRLVALRLRIAVQPPWKTRPRRSPPADADRRLEVLWAAGSSLLHIDPIFAAHAITQHLVLAFRAGSRVHEAKALAFEAVMLTTAGEKKLTEASTLLAAAERRANACPDPTIAAVVHMGAGFMWGNVGRYREAIAEGRRCIEALERAPSAPNHELTHAKLELGWRLAMIGELRELLSMVPGLLRRAIECEDPVLAAAFHAQAATAHLAADRPDEAATHIDEGQRWCPETYEAGIFGLFWAGISHLLYERRFADALALVRTRRERMESLRLLQLPVVRTFYGYRVGLVLLWARAAGIDEPADRRWLDKIRRELAGRTFPVAVAHSRLFEASCRALAGDQEIAMGHLREAIDRLASLGWDNTSTLAKIRYCQEQGTPVDGQLEQRLERLGVQAPDRWEVCVLPPFAPPSA